MTNKEAINLISRNKSVFQYDTEMIKALELAIKALEEQPTGEWIPVKFRLCTDEEFERMKKLLGEDIERDDFPIFDCPMPKDEQEVLISSHWGVEKDIAHYENGAYWLDCRDNWEGVEAWMPSPEQYKGGKK